MEQQKTVTGTTAKEEFEDDCRENEKHGGEQLRYPGDV